MVVVSCGGGAPQDEIAEKMIEKAIKHSGGGDADVDIAKGKVQIKGEDGDTEITFEEGEWPKDLPDAVPDFKMGKVKAVSRFDREGKKGWNVVVEEIQEGAFTKYAEQLQGGGWTLRGNMTTDKGSMIQATRDDLQIIAMYNKAEAHGTIGISTQ
jgi:hypothetical protein